MWYPEGEATDCAGGFEGRRLLILLLLVVGLGVIEALAVMGLTATAEEGGSVDGGGGCCCDTSGYCGSQEPDCRDGTKGSPTGLAAGGGDVKGDMPLTLNSPNPPTLN